MLNTTPAILFVVNLAGATTGNPPTHNKLYHITTTAISQSLYVNHRQFLKTSQQHLQEGVQGEMPHEVARQRSRSFGVAIGRGQKTHREYR